MSVLIFIIILSVLIVVHELGHFLVARWAKIRVDEFGIGFPPRAKKLFTWKGTPFTLNWLPFGGFVKIFGENPEEQDGDSAKDSFQSKNRAIQAAVLSAGVFFNFLFAWLLISVGFVAGIPSPATDRFAVENLQTMVTEVLEGSPADQADIRAGDIILSLERGNEMVPGDNETLSAEAASAFIAASNEPIIFEISRGENILEKTIAPTAGILEDRPAVGVSMDLVGIAKLPLHQAVWQGLITTWELTVATAFSLADFVTEAVRGKADLSGVAGPVGIAGMVGDVRELGFVHLMTFAALISINLAIINLVPFPALDGGRLVFVAIEAITRRKVPATIFNYANAAGFALLIFLMLVITARDVKNLF